MAGCFICVLFFHWTFGVTEADCCGAIDVDSKKSVLFVPKLPESYATWMGEIYPCEHFKEKYAVDEVHYTTDVSTLSLRLLKTDMELEVLRYTNRISSEVHKEVMKRVKPGMKEYEMESGNNSSILHCGHAGAPNDQKIYFLKQHYKCLYCHFSSCMLKFEFCYLRMHFLKEQVHWTDMHRLADRVHLEELVKVGILRGNVEEMLKVHLGSVFMPHGLGHMLGIDVHGVGGYPEVRSDHIKKGEIHLDYFFMVMYTFRLYLYDYCSSCVSLSVSQVCIEDDIAVTADGVELLTCSPRTVEKIEAFIADETPKPFSPISSQKL
uniref:Peptidase D n=1 Tax=Sinocyclocheilus rhinocerous TaxID=307959 RepID=A0A673HJG7_9TELE